MIVVTKDEIIKTLSVEIALKKIEEGFKKYSQKLATIPMPSSLRFEHPPGDCHIKYGFLNEGSYFIIKIATGFPENPSRGAQAGNGMMLLFSKKNGAPLYLLQDEGYLTDVRTACAGALAAKYVAPKHISCIGIVGTGAQSYFQLSLLPYVTDCRKVMIWGRDLRKAQKVAVSDALKHFEIKVAGSLDELAKACNLIVTTTSSSIPLLQSHHLRPGMHITAVGTDDKGKQELDPFLFAKADRVIVDSISQCSSFGDTSYALECGAIHKDQLIELGEVIAGEKLGRTQETEITIVDLTGVAIQDLQIALALVETLEEKAICFRGT
jgi:ornithine cyclodeaminase